MDTQIVLVFCMSDDMFKAINHREDPQCRVCDAEIMTIAIVAALYYGGNYALSRTFLKEQGYIPGMLGKSRFSRRLNRIKHHFVTLFNVLARMWKDLNTDGIYVLDTFPVAVCDNIRIPRCNIYQAEEYRGYKPSKKRYFYGLKIHMMTTKEGQPVEFFLTCGAFSDTAGLELFDFDLPEGSIIIGDKAYNYYAIEDQLAEHGIELRPIRKINSLRQLPPWTQYLQHYYRKAIETAGSTLERLLPKSIHATNSEGFELKVALFSLSSSIICIKSP
ncbi:MAG: IS982 family transposase [Acidobacteriota bacterium]